MSGVFYPANSISGLHAASVDILESLIGDVKFGVVGVFFLIKSQNL